METTLILSCGIDGCTELVHAEYDPGEPQTRDYPGYLGFWFAHTHGNEFGPKIGDNEHLDILCDDDNFHVRCDQIASESFDNDVWDF